ncbi:MAG: hypothetical protein WC371_04235, partial [Parachlamydiales bacterium]
MLKKLVFGLVFLTGIGLFLSSGRLQEYWQKSTFKKISLKQGRLVLKGFSFQNRRLAFFSEKIYFPLFSLKDPIVLVHPELVLKEKSAFSGKKRFFSFRRWMAKEGRLTLRFGQGPEVELFFSKDEKKMLFSLEKEALDQVEYRFFEQSLAFRRLPVAKLVFFAQALGLEKKLALADLKGCFSGQGFFRSGQLDLKLDLENLSFFEKNLGLGCAFEKIGLLIWKDRLDPWEKLQVKGVFEQGKIAAQKKGCLQGSFAWQKSRFVFQLQGHLPEIGAASWTLEGKSFFAKGKRQLFLNWQNAVSSFEFSQTGQEKVVLKSRRLNPEAGALLRFFFKNRFPRLADYDWLSGTLSLDLEADLAFGRVLCFKLRALEGSGLHLSGPHSLDLERIEGCLDLDFNRNNPLQTADLKVRGAYLGEIGHKKLELKNGRLDFLFKQGFFQPSILSFDLNGFQARLKLSGPEEGLKAFFFGRGGLKGLLEKDDELSCNLTFKKVPKGAMLSGLVQLKEKEAENQALSFDLALKRLSLNGLFQDFLPELKFFSIKAEKLNLAKWSSLFLDPDFLILKGRANLSCFYQNKEINLDLQGEKLFLKTPALEVFVPALGRVDDLFLTEALNFSYDGKKQNLSLKAPLLKELFLNWNGLAGRFFEAGLKARGGQLALEVPKGVLNGIALKGELLLDLFEQKKWTLDIQRAEGE